MTSSDYVVTAKVGHNDEQFPDILKLYVPKGSTIADVTWGRGIFWKQVNDYDYRILRSDLNADSVDVRSDFQRLPYADSSLDGLVLDPPYLYTGGWKTLRGYFHEDNERWSGSTYGNKERAEKGVSGVQAVDQMYFQGILEAHRCLKHKGILILKCMDQVMSGKQVWAHFTYNEFACAHGFRSEDLFVTVRKSLPLMRHKPEAQKHARKNHSYFLVLKNWKR
jgi:tRNA G10  N-methylase Trm11